MAEIRQIQVDGVNYDLVISEDEVSATAAAQSAAQALAYKNQAQSSAAQAQTQATNASNQADRAEDAASRAEQIVGGEFLSYGGDQGLDETQKEQARKNAVVGKSNYNLLDNGWFTVRQRGNGSFGIGYGVDRWTAVGGAPTITPRDPYGITLSWSTAIALDQYLNVNSQWLVGKTVTLSVMVDGTVYSASGVYNATGSYIININVGNALFRLGYFTSKQCPFVRIGNVTSGVETTINVDAIKLELGTYSTLGNDSTPDYATELARCIYSRADSTDFYANNGFGRSNRNLLDNPWWGSGEIINQRQITTLGGGFVFDRWKYEVSGSGNVAEVTSSGVAFTYTTGYFDVYQTLEPSLVSFLTGKVATVSALLDDGRIIKGSATFPATTTINITHQSAGVQIIYQPSYSRIYFRPYTNCTIRAVKLELGSVSTIANDTPPDYGEELSRCIYSTADPSDTYANNGFGRSNRNLLDNPWWGSGEVVNQRSFSSGSTAHNVFCIDRWKTSYGSTAGTISLGADGLTITAASGTYALINQVIEIYSALSGKTVTASALLSNGTIVSGTVANLNWANNPIVVTSGNVRLQLLSGGYFRVTILNGGSATIRAVKLEIGSVSTLANDSPPDYGEELAKCMRYFIRIKGDPIGSGYVTAGLNQAYIHIPTPVPMRTAPTASINGSMYIRGTGATWNVSTVTVPSTSLQPTNGVSVIAAISATQVMAVGAYMSSANSYIDLTADL